MSWVAVGVTTASAVGGYMSSKEANKGRKRPSHIVDAEKFAVERGREIADRPYQAFSGQRVAGLSGNERMASQLARTGQDEARGYIKQAGDRVSQLGSFADADIAGYTNPYVDAVLSPQLREANRAFDRSRSALLNTKAGAWGGDRVAFEASELARQHGELITDITARAHSEAFDRATQLWSQDQDRQLRAAEALRAVGGDVAQLNREQIQDLMATGGVERLLKQAELDFDYQQFLENRDWSITNLQPLLDTISVAQGGERNRQPEADPWGAALGAAATVAGMYFASTDGKDKGKKDDPKPVMGGAP